MKGFLLILVGVGYMPSHWFFGLICIIVGLWPRDS